MKTNLMDIPNKVYRYRVWDEDKHNQILTKRIIRLTSPLELGADYPETRLPIDYSVIDERYRKKIAKYHAEKMLENGTRSEKRKLARNLRKKMIIDDEEHRKEFNLWHRKKNDETLGVFCTSLEYLDLTIWTKLGMMGSGYCVSFHTNELDKQIGGAMGYVDYYPESNPPKVAPISFSERESIEKKSKEIYNIPEKFSYEKEFRFSKTNRIIKGGIVQPYVEKDRLIKLPSSVYSEIILGYDISEEDKMSIIDARDKELPHIPIWITELINNRIEVTSII